MNEPAHLNSGLHFAEEDDVLKWLADAAQIFRISSLPQEGKKLYMQMIDTAFQNFTHTVVPWFFDTFSDSERFSWVVADQHWYTAWDSKNCDMRTDEAGGLTCDTPLETIRHAAHAHWLEMFTMAVKVSDRTISTDGQFELWTTGLPHLYPSELV